jgi:hypothetical protein
MSVEDSNGDKQERMGLGIGIGLIIGAGLGLSTDNLAFWFPMGIVIGVVIGELLDNSWTTGSGR